MKSVSSRMHGYDSKKNEARKCLGTKREVDMNNYEPQIYVKTTMDRKANEKN